MALKIGANAQLKSAHTELIEPSEAHLNKCAECQDGEMTASVRNSELTKSLRKMIGYGTTVIMDDRGNAVHNNRTAWKTFINNEIKILTRLNIPVDGSDPNIPDYTKIEYNDLAPYISRYENAQESKKDDVFNEFCKFMETKYFNGTQIG